MHPGNTRAVTSGGRLKPLKGAVRNKNYCPPLLSRKVTASVLPNVFAIFNGV